MDLLCPSAPAQSDEAVVFGVVLGTPEAPRVAYLEAPLPVTPELIARTSPASPNEVLRTAAPCAEGACRHFDGASCTLASRFVELLEAAVDRPPPCRIRPSCRWWQQEGRAACARCPQVVTASQAASSAFRRAAEPPAAEAE